MRFATLVSTLALLAACTTGPVADEDTGGAAEYTEAGKADGQTQPKVSTTGITLWVDRNATVENRDGHPAIIIRGRTSKNLENVFSWVPDDAFGTATLTSARKFEVALPLGSEANTILSGLPINVDITASVGSVRNYHAQIALEGRFARFSSNEQGLWIEQEIAPIFTKDPGNPLRYRGTAGTADPADAFTVTTADGTDPTVRRVDDLGWTFDWSYDAFAQVFDDPQAPVGFVATTGSESIDKQAGIDLRVVSLRITTEDPYEAWPTPTCEVEVYDCMAASTPDVPDYAACGTYRQVQRCIHADACEIHMPEPLALTALDATALEPARAAYANACAQGNVWCSMDSITAYTLPPCSADPITMERLAQLVAGQIQDFPSENGMDLIDDQLADTPAFGTSYSSGGPALREALSAFAGVHHVEAYYMSSEVSCHNCTEFADAYVLYYPEANRVIAIQAGHGFDS